MLEEVTEVDEKMDLMNTHIESRGESSSHTQMTIPDHIVIEVEEMMKKKIADLSTDFLQDEAPTIFKVHPSIREEDPIAYEPRLISIGPYHRDKNIAMEKMKWKYLQDHCHRSQVPLSKYVAALRQVEQRVRKCYADTIDLDEKLFLEMLVLDGCFVIEFFMKVAENKLEAQFKNVKWNMPLLRNDLLLLENQIPFLVLQILFEKSCISFPPNGRKMDMVDFAYYFVSSWEVHFLPDEYRNKNIYHLLHLSHIYRLHGFDPNRGPDTSGSSCFASTTKWSRRSFWKIFYSFASMLLMWKLPELCRKKPTKTPRTIPSASELRLAGLKFVEKRTDCCILDVSYRYGRIEMPRLIVDQKFLPFLKNIVAFEQCCPKIEYRFTAYAIFLDNLVDTEKDVAILEDHRVLESKLGSCNDVAKHINKLSVGIHMNFQNHYLATVFSDIRDFYELDEHQSRAKLMQDYFGNPWARISFLAALAILVLTALQTVYTIIK